jgi:hypothetical protein
MGYDLVRMRQTKIIMTGGQKAWHSTLQGTQANIHHYPDRFKWIKRYVYAANQVLSFNSASSNVSDMCPLDWDAQVYVAIGIT